MAKTFKINREDIEVEFGVKLKSRTTALGLDTASTTGYAIATSNGKTITFDTGYFKLDLKNIKDKKLRELLRYEMVYQNLLEIIKNDRITVIENVYHGVNPKTTIMLARIGTIAYTIARMRGIPKENIKWYTASEARKNIGLKGNGKKPEIMDAVNRILGTDIKNDNIVDAIVLAINGLIDG